MGYNVEVSINLSKCKNIAEIQTIIRDTAISVECDNIYMLTEEDGTIKIPRNHCIFTILFSDNKFNNLLQFIRKIKHYKQIHVESVYNDVSNRLVYASSTYLKTINKDISHKYKNYIKDGKFDYVDADIVKEFT